MDRQTGDEQQGERHGMYVGSNRQKESQQAALALLLGPETEEHVRARATQRLVRRGPPALPLVLVTLNNYPEITTPAWPWWPPQYKYSSHLLLQLAQKAQLSLPTLLTHPAVTLPVGPVLWISVIEASNLLPEEHYEVLLQQALLAPWETVRYAAAMALATHPYKKPLSEPTLALLRQCLQQQEPVPVWLTIAYALLTNGETAPGMEALLHAISPSMPEEVRKAAAFILATELPCALMPDQQQRLTSSLLQLLQGKNLEIAYLTGHAISKIATPALLPALYKLLTQSSAQRQIIILNTFEEIAQQPHLRPEMQRQGLLTHFLPYLQDTSSEVRRQASYTLAAYGGEYVLAALGSILLQKDHPGRLEVIEGLRHLHNIHKAPTRMTVVRWLLQLLHHSSNEVKIAALDSLIDILLQMRVRAYKRAWDDLCREIAHDTIIPQLLTLPNAWVRQNTVDLISMLGPHRAALSALHQPLLEMLHSDKDSGVRASVAYTCGQLKMHQALPELLHTLLDEDEHVAMTALNALSHIITREDSITHYVLQELCYLADSPHPAFSALGKEAQHCSKKFQDKKNLDGERLHGFD
jgi:HEAT repeat protein